MSAKTVTKLAIALFIGGLAACGPQPKPPVTSGDGVDPNGGAGGDTSLESGASVTPESVCARIFELKAASCSLTDGYDLTEDECRADMRRSLEERGPDAQQATTSTGRCLLDNQTCEAIGQCMANLNQHPQDGSQTELRACSETSVYAPVGLPAAEWAKRRGAGARRYSELPTTKEEPIEVCGIPAEMDWLMSVTCDDGSRPFRNNDQAHAARVGNVGAGGACGSIIDLYEVACPEGTHRIFMDAYVCPAP